ncbi:hypothetical protein [Acinetobacter calcoaceticus]|uniref:hypothetical protein n=1 Tax=Acinetobacter calcoaceticus TaxID=471 RepID=UPI0018DE74A4|nr:hypothetical protein [Acinetobacter calcoaceticus]
MLFHPDEIKKLNYFEETAHVLNTISIAFQRFEATFYLSEASGNGTLNIKEFDYSLIQGLQDFKSLLLKYEAILVRKSVYRDSYGDLISDFNRSLSDSFALYEGHNEDFVSLVLTNLFNFTQNFNRFLNEKLNVDEVLNVPELPTFIDPIIDLINLKVRIKLKLKVMELENISDELSFIKNNILDLKIRYDNLVMDHRNSTSNFLETQRELYQNSMENIISNLHNYSREMKNRYDDDIKDEIANLLIEIENSKEEMQRLNWNIESFQNIASTETQKEISKHYFKKAGSEKITYWVATGATICLILLSLGLVAWALYDYYNNYISISNCVGNNNINTCLANLRAVRDATQSLGITFFIMRFAFSLLLFLTVIYTSRIAIRAYNHWRHSENMHLKLASLNPFIGNLDKEKRDEIHIGLVPDYFGKDSGVVEIQNDGLKDIPTNIANVAIKALEQAGGSFCGKSNTEKNGKKSEGGTE